MKSTLQLSGALLLALLLNPITGLAEDIDIYSGNTGDGGTPNVLIILDNSANWNGPFTAEKEALVSTVSGLNESVNIGLMMFAETGGGNDSVDGGYVRFGVRPMTGTNKTNLAAMVNALNSTTDKSNNAVYGLPMHEAYVYFAGINSRSGFGKVKRDYTGNVANNPLAATLSGNPFTSAADTTYTSPINNGCQKNFIVFISNGPAGDNSSSSSESNSLLAGVGGNTTTIALNPSGNQSNTADEWARFIGSNDVNSTEEGIQTIGTYTVDVNPGLTGGGPAHTALLKSMAAQGRGKYFAVTGDSSAIAQAILKILNEVQAVNSVFASSSLPVSVNAQGTFLNQIYMGMFRPDASGLPRWVGNLKQYKFGINDTTQSLSLVDSLGKGAISGSGTGFLSPNAVSFWTCTTSTRATALTTGTDQISSRPYCENDPATGFWSALPQGVSGAYDLQDGELVEKGGAAQIMRLSYLFNKYAVNKTSPRNVYTHCPGGGSCSNDLTAPANAFATSNVSIDAGTFGTLSYVGIANITRSIISSTSTATVTTSGNHGFNTGDSITITGATPTAYNGTFTITVTATNKFTFPVVEYPPTPATGLYQAILHSLTAKSVTALSRSSSTTSTANTETVTATAPAHGFVTGDSINMAGADPSNYNGTYTITNTGVNSFTYPITISPPATATGSYAVAYAATPTAITNSSLNYSWVGGGTKKGTVTVTTATPHGFVTNDYVTIAGVLPATYNGSYNIVKTSSTVFTYVLCSGSNCAPAAVTTKGTSTLGAAQQSITLLTRVGTAYAASSPYPNTATANISTANRYATGDVVKIVTIVAGSNDSQYYSTGPYTITCATTACTTFTYNINASPSMPVTGTITAAPSTTTAQNISSLTRTYPGGTTVTATLPGPPGFVTGNQVDISKQPGTTLPAIESAYAAQTWTITCVGASPCTQFTYGPITLTPGNSTVGGTASKKVAPNKDPLINWVRGEDNFGDEPSPDPTYTKINVRPSLHGDVLHSRPTVINYGGTTGVVIFYGANDGVYRAVNGNQTAAIDSTPAGGELWSFIPTEFFGRLQRMHDNSPVLKLASTPSGIVPPPQTKDYFVDGSTSVYQKINASGGTTDAHIYLSMRRGGRLLYALDVSDPVKPIFLWKRDNSSTNFEELGQTWSQPKVAFIKGHEGPVLIFGAGYDAAAEDVDGPPAASTMGRGIFVVDAITGNMIWKTTYSDDSSCSTLTPAPVACKMKYSIPADITLLDQSGSDGYIDRLYAVDMGGNIWRVDLEPTAGNTPDKWVLTHLAALGCNTGSCAAGTTPRKFFFAPDMVATPLYNAVLVGSGDREHPLLSHQSYTDVNRFYMVKDSNVGNNGTDLSYTETELKDITPAGECATSASYDGTKDGYYFTLCAGEKVVNAPLTVAGWTYFGTNAPKKSDSKSCSANLGVAKGYRIRPLTGESDSVIYGGGGLPPSAVAGLVEIDINEDGKTEVSTFCIGCGGDPAGTGADSGSSTGVNKPQVTVSTKRNKTYWYIDGK